MVFQNGMYLGSESDYKYQGNSKFHTIQPAIATIAFGSSSSRGFASMEETKIAAFSAWIRFEYLLVPKKSGAKISRNGSMLERSVIVK